MISEPDLSKVPPAVRPLLRHCLEKGPKKRLRDIGDFEFLLARSEPAPSQAARRRESGGNFVQSFPGPGLRRQIVATPGRVQWSRNGKEILYESGGGIYSVGVATVGGEPRFGTPVLLLTGVRVPAGLNSSNHHLAVSRDGSRIFWPQAAELGRDPNQNPWRELTRKTIGCLASSANANGVFGQFDRAPRPWGTTASAPVILLHQG